MKKKFDIIRAKKFAEDLKSGKDILNIKKNKFLSLRKKNNNKNNYNRIIKGKGIEENKKYSLYEFDESDFTNDKNVLDRASVLIKSQRVKLQLCWLFIFACFNKKYL